MNDDWKNYLLAQGARLNSGDGTNVYFHFDDEAVDNQHAEGSTILCDLSQYGLLVVAGADAATFMQGQFTNDVKKVDADSSQLNAFCNNKGRMIANFRLFEYQHNYFLSLKSDLIDTSIRHLQSYILRAQVAVQDISEQLIHLGLSGDNASELLSAFIDNIDEQTDRVSHNENYIAIRVAGNRPRYEIFCDVKHAIELWESVCQQAQAVSSSSWEYLNIQAGLPFIDASSSEQYVPQMTNMELLNGVSFSKGCYTGQEIVARMHYLGKLKKRCYRLHIDTETRPRGGDRLFAENARAGQNTGAIIQAEKNPQAGYDALAVIQIADVSSKLFLNDAAGPTVTVKELPYSLASPL